MGKEYLIRIEETDLGQILDGLRCRQESWVNTAIYLRDGYFPDDAFVCNECSDAHEATKIAEYYDRIIKMVEKQMEGQRVGK